MKYGSTRMRLGIDLDGVTFQFEKAFKPIAAARLGINPNDIPDASDWNWYEHLGIDAAGFNQLLADAVAHDNLFAEGDPVPGAVSALRHLARNHDIVIVTHRNLAGHTAKAEAATRQWLTAHRIPFHELHLTGNKVAVHTDIHLDDSPAVNADMRAAGRRHVVFDQPWNQDLPGERVRSWAEFVALVEATDTGQIAA